jgi:predicted CopG family antitoxin
MAIFLTGQGGERKEIDPSALMQLAANKKGKGSFSDAPRKYLGAIKKGRGVFDPAFQGKSRAEANKIQTERIIDLISKVSKTGMIAKSIGDIFDIGKEIGLSPLKPGVEDESILSPKILQSGKSSIPEVKREIVDVNFNALKPNTRVEVHINPSKNDLLRLIKDSTGKHESGVGFIEGDLRYSIHPDTGALRVWRAFEGTHDQGAAAFPGTPGAGPDTGYIANTEKGLIVIDGLGRRIGKSKNPALQRLLKKHETIGDVFGAKPEVGKRRVLDVNTKDHFSTYSQEQTEVIVNPSKGDLFRLIKESVGKGFSFEEGQLRYSINPDTKELHVWRAFSATHAGVGDALKLPTLGADSGFIFLKDGKLTSETGFGGELSIDDLLKGARIEKKTIGETFKAGPEEKEPPTIDEAFPDKENIVSFSSVDLKDSFPKAVLDKFSKAGLIPDQFDVDLFGGAGGIFKEAGREQAKTMFKFPKQEGFPSVDLTKARTDLADGSVGSVIADFPFLVNKYLGSSSSSTKKLGAIQGSFAVNTKGELKLIQITGAMEAIRILKPGGVVLFKTQDVRPASGSGRKIFIPSTQVIMDVAEGQGMKLIGRQSVKSRGKGIKPVEWLVYKKPTGDVLPFKKEK